MTLPVDTFPNLAAFNYDEVRAHIRSGDILLCSGNALFSKLIQRATQSVWSHVAFVLRVEALDRIMVLESVESIGVRTVPLRNYVENYNGTGTGYPGRMLIARHKDFKLSEIGALSKHAVDLFGYPYNTDDILRIAARVGMNSIGFHKNDDLIQPGKAYICSEYAYECYKSVGVKIEYDTEGFIAPADFAKSPAVEAVCFLK